MFMKLSIISLYFLISTCFAYNPITFDQFTVPTTMTALAEHPFSSRISIDARIWQGERDLGLILTEPDSSVTCTVSNGASTIISKSNHSSFTTFQYDGKDNSMKFTNSSINPQNLYAGDAKGFQLHIIVQNEASGLIFVSLSGGRICSYQFPVSVGSPLYLLDFDYFNYGHEHCDFSKVVGVELNIIFESANIGSLTFFGTFSDGGHMPSRVDEFLVADAIFEPLDDSMQFPRVLRSPSDCCFGSIIGGQRDCFFDITQVNCDRSFLQSNITGRTWTLVTGPGIQGIACLQFDGSDVNNNLVANGLNSLDFTDQQLRDALLLEVVTNSTVHVEVTAYVASKSNVSSGSHTVSVYPNYFTIIFPFDQFVPAVDFTKIGALEIRVQLDAGVSLNIWNVSFINQQNWMP